MNICLFSPEECHKPLDLRDERAKHIITVLHKKAGDSFCAGIIDGEAGTATIERIQEAEMTSPSGKSYKGGLMYFSFRPENDGKPLYPLTMLIGFPRPIQLKRLLRDMAGLGVCSVYLCGTDLVEKSYLKSTLYDQAECRKMLLEGTVQAASSHVPTVKILPSLDCALKLLQEEERLYGNSPLHLAMDNIRAEGSLSSFLRQRESELQENGCRAVSAIGSERGWSERERNLLEENGFHLLGMGKRVLRTESAATVSASLILSAMGFL
ncbi:MAG: RsmE family RNA methyltransferase [Treponema sp.]|nr:RsmE family RNA methyltransferase [Treponema sp.]